MQKNLSSFSSLGLALVLVIAVIIIANIIFSGIRLDLTENKLFTLSQGTENILDSLEEPISLDFYFSRKTLSDFPSLTNYATRVRDLLEEYAAKSNGKIKLTVIEPEPFSEEEDQAVANGLQGVSISNVGDRAYFGLVGSNSIDTLETIPFFQAEKETALEYDITKMVYNLANPEKRTIGVITSLPLFGQARMGPQGQQGSRPWAIINAMREFFEVRDLGTNLEKIDDDISVLLVIHPKELDESTLFAIDQYLLGGGNTMIFVDPLSENDIPQTNPAMPMGIPVLASNLKTILDGWGVNVVDGKIAGDITLAMRVQTRGPRGPEETTYLPWLGLDENNLNQEDFTTNELSIIHMGTAGIIEKQEDSSIRLEPLIETTSMSMQIDSNRLLFQQDPAAMLNDFEPENKKQILAARLSGQVSSAFPDGKPNAEENDSTEVLKEGEVHAILVADTDILADMFWIRTQSFFGMEIPQTIANNGDFVINTLENLSGNTDLVSLRSRGEFARPFTVVETIRREAEEKFREREQLLQARLEETENKIIALQQESGDSSIILSPQQAQEIEKFRDEQIKTRKELRAVQHELQKNIEGLGTVLKFINIGLMPLLIALIAIFAGVYRSGRRA